MKVIAASEIHGSAGLDDKALKAALSQYLTSPPRRIEGRYTIEGLEHLEAAREAKRGVLLLSAHFHTIEISGQHVAE